MVFPHEPIPAIWRRYYPRDWLFPGRKRSVRLSETSIQKAFTRAKRSAQVNKVHDQDIYGLLFESVWATLRTFGADPKRLDGQLGMTAVLHIWGQTLTWSRTSALPGAGRGVDRAGRMESSQEHLPVSGSSAVAPCPWGLRQPAAPGR